MAKKKGKGRKPRVMVDGTVYLIRLWIDGTEVYKVGVTTHSVARRVLGIIESVWRTYGYFPRVDIVYQCRTRNHYGVEAKVHEELRGMDYGYRSGFEFSGSSELFKGDGLDNEMVIGIIDKWIGSDEAVSAESIDRISDVM